MADLHLRPAEPRDDAAVRRVAVEAFGAESPEHGDRVAAIVEELGANGLLRRSLVAESGGEVVGHVATSLAWLDARDRLVDVWVLSPLGVLPGHQGDGIGTALVAAAVEETRGAGAPLLFLEGSRDYYGRRGFEVAADLGFRPPTLRIPRPAFQVVTFPSWDGSNGALVYPDVWWRHDSTGLRDPLLAELEDAFGTWDD